MISVYRLSETLGEKRKLRAARGSGITVVKPARLHFARAAPRPVSEAFCPNIQPRAHARLTGLTSITATTLEAM